MHLVCHGVPGSPVFAKTYVFLKPGRLLVSTEIGGETTLMGYGIGDRIKVLEPRLQYMIIKYKEKPYLELADGTFAYKADDNWPETKPVP